jgi:hypothetical protein
MGAGVGDRIVVESEQAAQSGRAGVIEEVLAHDPPRFRVRWDEGRTSIFAPLGRCGADRAEQETAHAGLTAGRPVGYAHVLIEQTSEIGPTSKSRRPPGRRLWGYSASRRSSSARTTSMPTDARGNPQ